MVEGARLPIKERFNVFAFTRQWAFSNEDAVSINSYLIRCFRDQRED
jgi:hypothetical protein